jgi:DNA-binding response OmpR family regulator
MAEAKQKILIVEDDLDVAKLLKAYFSAQGYDVQDAHRGEEGVRDCLNTHPDVVILDIRLPDIDGYEVARRLRNNHRTAEIPIIFLTEKRERNERLQGLELGADDYIPKPFDVLELELRIRNTLRRVTQDTLTNPITGLPDGRLVDERLSEDLHKIDWSMLIIALENLEYFRETYGFVASDDVLRAVGLMLQNTLKELGTQEDFLGQFGPTDFILVTNQERVSVLRERVLSRLEQSLDYFYPIKDREKPNLGSKRLFIRTGLLQAGQERYSSLDDLKITLLRQKFQEHP